jgi:hypothetical protein
MTELTWVASEKADAEPVTSRAARLMRIERVAWAVATIILLVSVAWMLATKPASPTRAEAIRFVIPPPEGTILTTSVTGSGPVVVSPDGRYLAFVAENADGSSQLWVRPLDSPLAQPLRGTDRAAYPFWSPDSRWIAFFAQGTLKKIGRSGEALQLVLDVPSGMAGAFGGTWGRDDTILFSDGGTGIYRTSADGGAAVPVTTLDASREEIGHAWPYFLPDGRHFLFVAVSRRPELTDVEATTLGSHERARVLAGSSTVAYVPTGHLLFSNRQQVMAQPFDVRTVRPSGEPIAIAGGVGSNRTARRAFFSVSATGVLAYMTNVPQFDVSDSSPFVWFDRAGNRVGSIGGGRGSGFSLSPDGQKIAFNAPSGETGNFRHLGPRHLAWGPVACDVKPGRRSQSDLVARQQPHRVQFEPPWGVRSLSTACDGRWRGRAAAEIGYAQDTDRLVA